MTITDVTTSELLYRNAWATDHALTESGRHANGCAARTRWQRKNENNHGRKNYGYHLAHNCGHGQPYLALVLLLLNRLAFLCHTFLNLCDEQQRCGRAARAARPSSTPCKP